jgi:hypothetical protein
MPRPNLLNQIGQDYNLYITRRIEPVYLNNNFYNKDIYGVHGEYLPDGQDSDKTTSSFNLQKLLDQVSSVNDGNCTLSQFNIEQTNGMGYVPFNFECECIEVPTDLGIKPAPPNGVVDVKNEINVQENVNDGTMTISRNIQVKAISIANSDPIQAAKSYAQALSGNITSWNLPTFSSKPGKQGSFTSPILISENQIGDIYNGTFTIQQNFLANLSQSSSSKKAIIKNEAQIQSGIDGIAILNLKSIAIGNKNMDQPMLKAEIVQTRVSIEGIDVPLSANVTYDEQSHTLEINEIYTNDKSIDDAYKITNTISYNFDFINENYSATTNSEARAVIRINQTNDAKSKINSSDAAHKKAATDFNPCKEVEFNRYSQSQNNNEKNVDNPRVASYSNSYVSSPSMIFNGEKLKYRDFSITVQYDAGFKKISATPLLSGAGTWYLEDLDYNSNSQVTVVVEGKYGEQDPSPTDLQTYITSGISEVAKLSETYLADEKFSLDKLNKTFNYTVTEIGKDTFFVD